MNTRKSSSIILIAILLATFMSALTSRSVLGQCQNTPGGCPPPSGEKDKRATKTPTALPPTFTPTPVVSVNPALVPPVPGNSDNSGGPTNPGNPGPGGKDPGPNGFSLLTNPWGLVGLLGAIIIVCFGGIFYFFRHGAGHHTMLGDTGGLGQLGNENFTVTRPDLSGNNENFTITRPDLNGGLQNATVARQDLGGGLQMNTIGGSEMNTIGGKDIGEIGGNL